MSKSKLNLVILGGGNGPHCYAGIAASQPDVEVRVLTLFQDEAERWTKAQGEGPFEITFTNWEQGKNRVFSGKPHIVTKDPKQAITGAHIIVFMVPACIHELYATAIAQFVEEGMVICGLPGRCGFHFQAIHYLGDKLQHCPLLCFESLPWACRINTFGRSATILAGKCTLSGASMGDLNKIIALGKTPVEALQYTLLNRPKLNVQGHLLGDTLMSPNACIHPSIEYGAWVDWDGKSMDEPCDFYHGCNELSAKMVNETSNEALKIRDAIQKARPNLCLSQVKHIKDWYCTTYGGDTINDMKDLYTIFRSHQGYCGIKHPMVKTDDGKYVPDFNYRYFTEDIPCGQVVLRGIAEIMGIETPYMDKVITWAQQKMGKEYLVDGKLKGKDLGETRCPQRFGITTLAGLLGEK